MMSLARLWPLTVVASLAVRCAPAELSEEEDEQLEAGQTLLSDDESLELQAQAYATDEGLALTEARERLATLARFHQAMAELEAADPQGLTATYAGAAVTARPFGVTVRFKGAAPEAARRLLSAFTLDQTARLSRAELSHEAASLTDLLAAQYPGRQIQVSVGDDGLLIRGLPAGAAVTSAVAPVTLAPLPATERMTLDPPAATPDGSDALDALAAAAGKCPLRGGESLYLSTTANCTSGFGATYCWPRGPRGCVPALLTAGHCANQVNYPHCEHVQTLNKREASTGPHGDWQVMIGSGAKRSARFQVRSDKYATVRGRINSYAVNDVFHKYGVKSGHTWGKVTDSDRSIAFESSDGSTTTVHHLVVYKNPAHGWVSRRGDSGGPVFSGKSAAGIVTGGSDTDSAFSPIRDLEQSLPNTSLNAN